MVGEFGQPSRCMCFEFSPLSHHACYVSLLQFKCTLRIISENSSPPLSLSLLPFCCFRHVNLFLFGFRAISDAIPITFNVLTFFILIISLYILLLKPYLLSLAPIFPHLPSLSPYSPLLPPPISNSRSHFLPVSTWITFQLLLSLFFQLFPPFPSDVFTLFSPIVYVHSPETSLSPSLLYLLFVRPPSTCIFFFFIPSVVSVLPFHSPSTPIGCMQFQLSPCQTLPSLLHPRFYSELHPFRSPDSLPSILPTALRSHVLYIHRVSPRKSILYHRRVHFFASSGEENLRHVPG